MKKKLFTMLALLCLTVVSAWAQSSFSVKTITADMVAQWEDDNTKMTAADLPGFKSISEDEAKAWL
jgi:hypothetical protein